MAQVMEKNDDALASNTDIGGRLDYAAPVLLVLQVGVATAAGSLGSAEGGFTHS